MPAFKFFKFTRSRPKLRLPFLIAVFLIIILAPILYFSLIKPQSASAWFDDNWAYRKRIIVTNNTSTESNKYVTLSSFDTSDTTRFQNDCGNVRFTKENGEVLPYYVASGCGTSSTSFNIFFDSLVAGTQNIYLYYGNQTAINGFVTTNFSSAATSASVGSPATEENSSSPILYWKFEEANDNTCPGGRNDICDVTQNRYDAVRSGATRQSQDNCLNGQCLSFDGTDDYAMMHDKDQLDFAASESFTISGWFRTSPKTSNTYTLLAKQQQSLSAGDTTVNAIVSNGNDGIGGYDAAWGSRTVYDPNNNRWHVVYVDNLSDLHSHSTAATSGTSWTDSGFDINTGTWDYEDFSCVGDVDGTNTYMHCVYATGGNDTLLYKRCTLSGGSPYISCDSEQTVYDSSVAGEGASDLIRFPRIAVDRNGCSMIIADYENAEGGAGNLQEVWLWKEAAPCGDGTFTSSTLEAGFPMKDIAGASGFNAVMAVGIKSYGNLDFQLYWIDTDGGTSSSDLETNIYYGETNTLGTERELESAVEYGTQNEFYNSVVFNSRNVTFAADESSTALHAYVVNTLNAALTTQITTQVSVPATTAQYDGYVTAAVDSIAAGGDNLYVFGMNNSDNTDIYYNTSTDGGTTWGGSATLWVNSFDSGEVKYFSSEFNRENCDIMVNWLGGFTAGSATVSTKLINTGSCTISANAGYKLQMESDGDVTFTVHDGTNTDSATSTAATYDDNQWHHVAAVKSGTSSIKLYIDGVEVASDTSLATTGSLVNSNPIYAGIAADGTSNPYAGFLDDLKIYRYARTVAQIKTDATRPPPPPKGAGASLGGTPQDFLTNGLVGYWPMNETSANTCTGGTNDNCDKSGNANDAAWTSTSNGVGKFGSGIVTTDNAALQYATVSDPSSGILDFGASDNFTISFWLKATGNDGAGVDVISKNINGDIPDTTAGYAIRVVDAGGSGNAECMYSDGSGGTYESASTGVLSTNGLWHHIVCVMDRSSGSFRLYNNGILQASDTSLTEGSAANNAGLVFGENSLSSNDLHAGFLDEVRIYNRALSSSEVASLYNWAPSPIAHYTLDDNTGTSSVKDNSSNAYTGTMNTIAESAWVPGKFGSALNFDGSSDYVSLPSGVNMTTGDFTISAWIKPTNVTPADIATIYGQKSTSSDTPQVQLYIGSSSNISCRIRDTSNNLIGGIGSTTAVVNTWYHVSCVREGTTARLYLNGIFNDSGSNGSLDSVTGNNWAIGAEYDDGSSIQDYFSGTIDDFRIYNYARTPAQIIEDMNASHPVGGSPISSQVAYWKFDEGSLNSCSGGTNDFCDSTPNANDLAFSTTSGGITTSGKYDKAFDGSGAIWATRADDADFDFAASEDFSISLWFKSDSTSNPASSQYLLSKGTITNTGTAGYALYANTSGNIVFGVKDDAAWGASSPNTPAPDDTATGTTDIYDNTWHHIVATKVGTSSINLYVDGQLNASDTSIAATASLDNAIALRFADDDADATNSFAGDIDELKIYRSALTTAQIATEYNQGKAVSLGSSSTTSAGIPDNSAARAYCVPGDSTSCSAPIVHWTIDENTGTSSTKDVSGSGNDGTLFGIVASDWVPGKFGGALSVDETDEVIYTTGTSAIDELPQGANGMTVQGWFYFRNSYTTVSTDRWLIGKDITASPRWHLAIIDNGGGDRLGLTVSTSGTAAQAYTTSIPASGQWFHIAGTYLNSTKVAQLYINGTTPSSYTQVTGTGTPNTDASEDLVVSDDNNGGNGIAAKLDDIRIYNYVRTPAQIAWDYNQGEPIAHYKFDECQGTTFYNSIKNANGDALGLNGTLTIGGSGSGTSAGTCSSGTGTQAWNNGTTGKINAAMSFDGTDDYGTITDNNALDIASSFSIAMWVYPRAFPGASSYDTLLNKIADAGGTANYYLELNDTNDVNCGFHDGTNWQDFEDANDNYSTNTWYHLVCVFDDSANTFKIYTNGLETHSASATTSPTVGAGDLHINNVNTVTNQQANSLTDEVRIYRYPLTAKQVQMLYNNGSVNFQ